MSCNKWINHFNKSKAGSCEKKKQNSFALGKNEKKIYTHNDALLFNELIGADKYLYTYLYKNTKERYKFAPTAV